MASPMAQADARKMLDRVLLVSFLMPSASTTPVDTLSIRKRANRRRSFYPTASTGGMKARTALNKDMAYASGESSADEEVEHPSTAPAPDAEVAYSFDATRGPSHGSQILNHALEKAIEKYEIKETDKLIKNEYDVLDADAEILSPLPKKRNIAPEDEDYFFVDA